MISDEKLTVIDFGNCTKLTKEQQGHVTRMMAAASVGDMELFRSGLHSLLKPEFEDLAAIARKLEISLREAAELLEEHA